MVLVRRSEDMDMDGVWIRTLEAFVEGEGARRDQYIMVYTGVPFGFLSADRHCAGMSAPIDQVGLSFADMSDRCPDNTGGRTGAR